MHGNQHLRSEVNKLLNAEEEEFMRDYMFKKREIAEVKADEKHKRVVKFATAEAEKSKNAEV